MKKSPHKSVQKSAKSCRCLMLFFVCHAGDSRVWGRHSPTRFPQGQNERKANFGTTVESCSKKLPLSSAALVCGYTGLLHQYSDCGGVFCPLFTTTTVKRGAFWQTQRKFFCFPCLLPTTIRRCGLPKIFENRRKKSSKPFSRFTAYVLLRWAAVLNCQRSKRNFNRLSISRPTICSCISVLICPSIFAQELIYPA